MDSFNNVIVKPGKQYNLLGYLGKIFFEKYSLILGALCLFVPHLFFLDWLYKGIAPFLWFRAPLHRLSWGAFLGLTAFFLLLTSALLGVYMVGMLVTKQYIHKEGEFKDFLKKVYQPPLLVFCKTLALILAYWVALFILQGFTGLFASARNEEIVNVVTQWLSLLGLFGMLTAAHLHSEAFAWTACEWHGVDLEAGKKNSLDVMKDHEEQVLNTHLFFSWPLFIVPVVLLLCSMILGEDIEALIGGSLLLPFVLGGCVYVTIAMYAITNTLLFNQLS